MTSFERIIGMNSLHPNLSCWAEENAKAGRWRDTSQARLPAIPLFCSSALPDRRNTLSPPQRCDSVRQRSLTLGPAPLSSTPPTPPSAPSTHRWPAEERPRSGRSRSSPSTGRRRGPSRACRSAAPSAVWSTCRSLRPARRRSPAFIEPRRGAAPTSASDRTTDGETPQEHKTRKKVANEWGWFLSCGWWAVMGRLLCKCSWLQLQVIQVTLDNYFSYLEIK